MPQDSAVKVPCRMVVLWIERFDRRLLSCGMQMTERKDAPSRADRNREEHKTKKS